MFSIKADGVSLLAASLCHWLSCGDKCPNVLVSTHFHNLTNEDFLPDTKLIEYLVGRKKAPAPFSNVLFVADYGIS